MLALLKLLDARLSEPSTYAGIAAMLMAANVNLDPGLVHAVTLYGSLLAGVVSILLSEVGNKPPAQVAFDVIQALASGLKALGPVTTTIAAPTTPPSPAATPAAPPATPAA